MTFKSTCFGLVSAAAMAVAMCGTAHAGLIGDTIDGAYYFPDSSTVFQDDGNMTVNPSASFFFATGTPNVTATVSDNQVDLSFSNQAGSFNPASFNGVVLTDLTHSLISGVTIDASSTLAGFTAADLSFTSNKILINLEGITVADLSEELVLDVDTAAVPEPASLAMLGTGILALGFFGWRRRDRRDAL